MSKTIKQMSNEEFEAYLAELDADHTLLDKAHTWGQTQPTVKSHIVGAVTGIGAVYTSFMLLPVITIAGSVAYTAVSLSDKVQKGTLNFFSQPKGREREVTAVKRARKSAIQETVPADEVSE